jgi:putative FmdB family regulatory protein
MPVYEYRCGGCGKKVALLVGVTAEPDDETCPQCGSRELVKLVSRFRRGRSEDDRIDELSDRLESMGEPESGTEMRHLVREMGKAMDDDMADEMEELFETDQDDAPEAED